MKLNLSVDLTSLAFWAGIPAMIFLFRLARQVWKRTIPPVGLASFAMWTTLDCLLLINTIRTGRPIWLPFGWVLGAGSVTWALWRRGSWMWTIDETVAATLAATAATVSVLSTGFIGLGASLAAMLIASWRITKDNLEKPVRGTFPLWFSTVVGCVMAFYGSDGSWEGTLLPIGSGLYNGFMAIVVLRGSKICESPAAAAAT